MDNILISILSLTAMGICFGAILAVLDKKLKVESNPLVEEVEKLLPGINCGACGYPGCRKFAEEAVKNKSLGKGCIPGGKETNDKIARLLGISASSANAKKAVIFCSGTNNAKKISSKYRGIISCAAVNLANAGPDCKYGCIGLGDCVKVCPAQAISIENGLCVIDPKKCIGCGLCVKACPRNIIHMVDPGNKDFIVKVACSNPGPMQEVKKVCSAGCIGCGLCTKIIPDSPFYMEKKLAAADNSKITSKKQIQPAIDKCPAKVIKIIDV